MSAKAYASPAAFKDALEDRIRRGSSGGLEIQRRRQVVVFTRLIARITAAFGDATVLKGGFRSRSGSSARAPRATSISSSSDPTRSSSSGCRPQDSSIWPTS